ncbi:MAG: hypothetical protein WCC26_10550 [Terracidiphilus sp.]
MKPFAQQILLVYSAVSATGLTAFLLTGAAAHPKQSFDEIQVHRIDVVEPDGTLRMVISNKDRLPPVIVKGVEHPEYGEPRPQAGMIFYNDEGSENGGLIFGGHKNEKGEVVDSGGSLSFDKYGASQVVQLAGVDDRSDRFAGLAVSDQKRRVWIGRTDDGNASIALMDATGKKRILMQVTDQGAPSISFLDAQGRVTRRLTPE